MRPGLPAVALLLAASLVASPVAGAEDDPFTLRFNPLRRGMDGWTRTGSDKAFTWTEAEALLAIKGQSGKEPPRLVHTKTAWDRGGMNLQAKKGARKLRLLVVPEKGGAATALEVPGSALGSASWTDLALRFGDGKAAVVVPDGGKEIVSAAIPAEGRFRMGFEAPSGADAVVSNVRFERLADERPQFHEPDFEPVFDGTQVAPWAPGNPASAPVFRAEKSVLVGEVRVEEFGWLALADRRYGAYEIRMNALWSTTFLEMRVVEVPGPGGQVNKFETVQVNLTDHLEDESMNEIAIRVAEGKVSAVVNGKTILETKTKDFEPTPISLFVARGKRCLLRDIRIRDLAPDATVRSGGAPEPAPAPAPTEKAAADEPWTAKGGFAGKDGTWSVEDAPEGTGLVKGGQPASFELRFKVGKGATGLTLVPRAVRGVERAAGVRLEDALFATREWTDVVLRVNLLSATVRAAGEQVGSMDLDHATGPPGLRVAAGGRARVKDLVLEPIR